MGQGLYVYANHQLQTGFILRKGIISAIKRVEFTSDSKSGGRWRDITVLNVLPPTEVENGDPKDSFYEEPEGVFDQFLRHHVNILLGDFNTKERKEDIFKPATGNESLHKINNDNGVRVVNFATSINVFVQSTMFPHRNIHKTHLDFHTQPG
jgi:hypothetical protein